MKPKRLIPLFAAIAAAGMIVWYLSPYGSNEKAEETRHIAPDAQMNGSEEEIPGQEFEITTTLAYRYRDELHADFRKHYKYHFQMIGLAEYPDSSYLFILSEPGPQVSEKNIKSVFTKFNCDFQTKEHKIGYDGFAKDMLVVVGRATKQNIAQLREALHTRFYFTSYKQDRSTIELPVKDHRRYFSETPVNYEILPAELDSWFMEENELFEGGDNTFFSIREALGNNEYGVFFSKNNGLAIWIIDKEKSLYDQRQTIRQFSLDADLVFGAFSNDRKLIVIGRERICSLAELPPLNVETVLLLASVDKSELAQSLDITDLLAGKMSNGKDWCPTYLSPELENTEFGHLLTITDLLLKDWSEHGDLKYEDYDYPKPESYPFDRSLFEKSGLNELVYNWNTDCAVIAVNANDYMIYSLNRTGSLPVSYFNSPDSKTSIGEKYERQAYAYFAKTGSTDLARVVQYQALYSLFRYNAIQYDGPPLNNNSPLQKPYLLKDNVRILLSNIKNLSDTEKTTIARKIAADFYKRYLAGEVEANMTSRKNSLRDEISKEKESMQQESAQQESEMAREIEKYKLENQTLVEDQISKATQETEQHIIKEIEKSGRSASDPEVIRFKNEVWAEHHKKIARYRRQNEVELNRNIAQYRQQGNERAEAYRKERHAKLANYEEEAMRRIETAPQENRDYYQQKIRSAIDKAQRVLSKLDDASFTDLCRYLSYPRGNEHTDPDTVAAAKEISAQIKEILGIYKGYYSYFGIDISQIMTLYSDALKENASLWIKTPSLVITHDNPNVVGGHNLSSIIRVVRTFSAANSIKFGKNTSNNRIDSLSIKRKRTEVIPIIQRRQRGL